MRVVLIAVVMEDDGWYLVDGEPVEVTHWMEQPTLPTDI
jgi:hypothetical protein